MHFGTIRFVCGFGWLCILRIAECGLGFIMGYMVSLAWFQLRLGRTERNYPWVCKADLWGSSKTLGILQQKQDKQPVWESWCFAGRQRSCRVPFLGRVPAGRTGRHWSTSYCFKSLFTSGLLFCIAAMGCQLPWHRFLAPASPWPFSEFTSCCPVCQTVWEWHVYLPGEPAPFLSRQCGA